MKTENSTPQILKERAACEKMLTENHNCTFQREQRSVCMTVLRTDKEMGNFWAWFWLMAFWEVGEVLDLMGEKVSEQYSQLPTPQRLEPC